VKLLHQFKAAAEKKEQAKRTHTKADPSLDIDNDIANSSDTDRRRVSRSSMRDPRSFSRMRSCAVRRPTLAKCQEQEKFLWEETISKNYDMDGWE